MTFSKTFTDLRKRRRIAMREFQDRVGVVPSYIYEIEKNGLLPNPERLTSLASVFSAIAEEQGADPEEEVRQLRQAYDKSLFTERLGLDEELADVLVSMRTLDGEGLDPSLRGVLMYLAQLDSDSRVALTETMAPSIRLHGSLDPQEQGGLARRIDRIARLVAGADTNAHRVLISALGDALDEVLDRFEEQHAPAPPQRAPRRRSAPRQRA